MQMIKNWMIQNRGYLMGAMLGALGGFLYWKYVGCLTGTCTITSSPVNSTVYFALLGALLFGSFKGGKKKSIEIKEEAPVNK